MICLFLRRPRDGQNSDGSFVFSFLGTIIIIETNNNEKIQNFALKPNLPTYVGKPHHAGNSIIVLAVIFSYRQMDLFVKHNMLTTIFSFIITKLFKFPFFNF